MFLKIIIFCLFFSSKVCPQYGESSIKATIAQKAYKQTEKKINRGVNLKFCKFVAA